MPYIVSHDNLKIYYKQLNKTSKKPCLFFIHGWLFNHRSFDYETDFFKKLEYRVICMDVRGHGHSDKPKKQSYYKLPKIIEDMNLILKKEKIKKVILVGHSMGGMISLAFYKKHPENVEKMVLISTLYKTLLSGKHLVNNLKETVKTIFKFHNKKRKQINELETQNLKKKRDVEIFVKEFEHTPTRVAVFFIGELMKYNAKKDLKNIKVPTLIIAGSRDQFFDLKYEKEMKNLIPKSKLIVYDATHSIIIKQAEKVSKDILKFIK